VGSGIVGANNVNIVATGRRQGSNIRAVGSTIAAGNTVNLAADNDVTLEASKNTSATVGPELQPWHQRGGHLRGRRTERLQHPAGCENGKGRDNQNETTYNATQVSGGNAVNVSSGP
jgi:filamentous hemagglutinin